VLLLQTALASKSTSTRTRVWTLTTNVSIAENGHMQCSWPDGNVTYPTQLLGAVVHTYGPTARMHDTGAVASPLSPEAIVLGHADANTNRNGTGGDPYLPYDAARPSVDAGPVHPPTHQELYSLSFGYVPSLFQLPVDAQVRKRRWYLLWPWRDSCCSASMGLCAELFCYKHTSTSSPAHRMYLLPVEH
jgi:hypothetical protein